MPTFDWTNTDGSQTPLNLRQPLSDADEAQRMARQDDRLGNPGQGIRFDYRATPEIADKVKDLLQHRYGWTLEIDRGHLFYMRKPKGEPTPPN